MIPSTAALASSPSVVQVIATTPERAGSALAVAIPFAHASRARVAVLVAHIVPEREALEPADGEVASIAAPYRTLLHELGAEAEIEIRHCRSLGDIVVRVPQQATVVIGGPVYESEPTAEESLAGLLRDTGRRVVFVPSVP